MVESQRTTETSQEIEAARRRGHEPEQASASGIVIFIICLFLGLAVVQGIVGGLIALFGQGIQEPVVEEAPSSLPDIAHWQNPPADLAQLTAQQKARLHRYAWVDRSQNIITIPIDQAIPLHARRMAQAQQSGAGDESSGHADTQPQPPNRAMPHEGGAR